jgi:hypothetical protein
LTLRLFWFFLQHLFGCHTVVVTAAVALVHIDPSGGGAHSRSSDQGVIALCRPHHTRSISQYIAYSATCWLLCESLGIFRAVLGKKGVRSAE